MLISNREFKTSVCCILMLSIMVANSAFGSALIGRIDDGSTVEEEHQDWRQHLPTVKRAVALLNKLVNRANLIKKQRHQQPNPLTKDSSQLQNLNEIIQHRADEQLLPKTSAEHIDGDHPIHQKAAYLPRMDVERRGQMSQRIFWRCYFNAVTCFR